MRARAVILVLCVALCSPAYARVPRFLCKLYSFLTPRPPVEAKAPAWKDWPTLQKKLERAQQDLEKEAANNRARDGDPQVGGTVRAMGGDYHIIGVFGSGGEGVTYLATMNGNKYVVKKYHSEETYFAGAYSLSESGKAHPKIIYRDGEEHAVVMEYIPGLPFSELHRAEKYGLTGAERNEISGHFEVTKPPRNAQGSTISDSTILSVKNGAFYLVDSQ